MVENRLGIYPRFSGTGGLMILEKNLEIKHTPFRNNISGCIYLPFV